MTLWIRCLLRFYFLLWLDITVKPLNSEISVVQSVLHNIQSFLRHFHYPDKRSRAFYDFSSQFFKIIYAIFVSLRRTGEQVFPIKNLRVFFFKIHCESYSPVSKIIRQKWHTPSSFSMIHLKTRISKRELRWFWIWLQMHRSIWFVIANFSWMSELFWEVDILFEIRHEILHGEVCIMKMAISQHVLRTERKKSEKRSTCVQKSLSHVSVWELWRRFLILKCMKLL